MVSPEMKTLLCGSGYLRMTTTQTWLTPQNQTTSVRSRGPRAWIRRVLLFGSPRTLRSVLRFCICLTLDPLLGATLTALSSVLPCRLVNRNVGAQCRSAKTSRISLDSDNIARSSGSRHFMLHAEHFEFRISGTTGPHSVRDDYHTLLEGFKSG